MRAGRAAAWAAVLALFAAILLALAPQVPASAKPNLAGAHGAEEPTVDAEAAIVVDADSGQVIAAEDAGEQRPIASATKLMTALLTLERTAPDEVLTAADYDATPIESQIGLSGGERLTVRDLLVALLLESANDAAVTLAEGVAGSAAAFVAEMNERADELGLDDTSYANPIGFDDPGNYSTASDQAELARRLMGEERFRDIVEEPSLELESGDRPRVVENRNELVRETDLVDGVKTGHTLAAGHVLVGSASDGSNRVISVVLGAPSERSRDAATLELLRYGLDQFVERRVVRSGEALARAAVADRDGEVVKLTAADDVSLTLLRGERPRTRIRAPDELEGPLPAGEPVGTVAVVRRGAAAERVALVTAAAVPAPGILTRVATTLGDAPAAVVALAVAAAAAALVVIVRARRRRARTRSGGVP